MGSAGLTAAASVELPRKSPNRSLLGTPPPTAGVSAAPRTKAKIYCWSFRICKCTKYLKCINTMSLFYLQVFMLLTLNDS